MRKVHYVANSQFRHIFFRHALVYEYSDRNPTRALDQATATQSPRCSTSVCLQDSKNRENLQINRTATVQQYRYSSIEQFSGIKNRENLQINRTATVQQYRYTSIEQSSSISAVYSSTIHPRANSPTLNPFSTTGVKSNPMSAIGISASETKASYRLCLALNRKFCDHEG